VRPADAQRLLGALAGADAPVGFAVFDDQYRYLAINAFLAERTGKTIADHLGRRPAEVLPPELSAHTEAMIDRVLSSGETVKADEPPVPSSSGTVPYLRSTWYLVSEGDRREVAMFVVDDTSQRSALSGGGGPPGPRPPPPPRLGGAPNDRRPPPAMTVGRVPGGRTTVLCAPRIGPVPADGPGASVYYHV
jgi:PAS domain S-box-containing protein